MNWRMEVQGSCFGQTENETFEIGVYGMFGIYGPPGVNNISGFGGLSGVHAVVIEGLIVRASVGVRGFGRRELEF